MATKLQHGDSLYQVIEKVNALIDGTVQPGSGGSGGSGSGSAAINGVQDMVYAEIDRAQAAEQYLQEQINAIATPESGDNAGATLDISSLQPALIIESLRAATAEQYNAASLSDEVTRAQTAEQTLQTNINNETTRATTAEQNLQDQIDNIDISELQQDIDDEVTRATTAEQNLQDQIDDITQGDGIIHSLISDLPVTVTADTLEYIVVNGICYVSAWNIKSTATGFVNLSNNMPKTKINALGIFTDGTANSIAGGDLFIEKNNSTQLRGIFPRANTGYYTSFSYPVDYS